MIKRIPTKCLSALLAFVLLPCFCLALGTSCAEPQPEKEIPFVPPNDTGIFESESDSWNDEHIPISVSFDYFGKKIKLSEKKSVLISYTVKDIAAPTNLNVLIIFENGEYDLAQSYRGNGPDIKPDNICYVMGRAKELKEFPPLCYTQEPLCFYFENGCEEYNDFYRDGCELYFLVDLRSLGVIESVETSSFGLRVFITPDASYKFAERFTNDIVFYATDGEYVAFSDISEEDAKAILTGIPVEEPPEEPPVEEPRGFWATLADIFDGCD